MSLKPKPVALWLTVPLLAMNLIACWDHEEVPQIGGTTELCGNGELDEGEECDDGNRNNQDDCTNQCTKATCGDGIVALKAKNPEECDDGNGVNTDACTNECKAARCGDGYKQPGEACDDGNDKDDDDCTTQCALPTCGDGEVQDGEECDDGNRRDDDGCTNTCLKATCGDGIVQAGEECDEGASNKNSGSCTRECKEAKCGDGHVWVGVEACDPLNDDNCTDDCKLPSCGDGVVQDGEECDDGPNGSDECTAKCLLAKCGDGIVQGEEECDDGNKSNNDSCLNTCKAARCGDGILHNQDGGREDCDDGDKNGPLPAVCSESCTLNNCGNGVVEPGEECDDGADNDDNASCTRSCKWNRCGDGRAYLNVSNPNNPNDLEECDDKNADDSDACLSTCEWNACGDGKPYTKGYSATYTSESDGNPNADNENLLEPCDDGNTSDNDSCVRIPDASQSSGYRCEFNTCGDGRPYTTKTDDNNPNPLEECDDANKSNNDSCLNTCVWNSCHDGWLYEVETDPNNPNELEQCDDGNTSNSDACVDECVPAACGDAHTWIGHEQCDDGNSNNADGCSNQCELPNCGNGFVDPGEECDDGNDNDNDSCLSTCQWNRCGDGFRYLAVTDTKNPNPLERCDDGNGIDTDPCTSACVWNTCGDGKAYVLDGPQACPAGRDPNAQVCDIDEDSGFVCNDADLNPMNDCSNPNAQEECDDGNAIDGDSCLSTCQFNSCGDGVVYTTKTDNSNPNPVEACDDAGASATCTATCEPVSCGDGVVSPEAGETCDPQADPWKDGGGCTADCKLVSCGNGEVDDGEECDDGNQNNADDCTDRCLKARCGDGYVQPSLGEECDDGNTDNTDSCTNACQEARCGDGVRQANEECDPGHPVFLKANGELEEIDLDDPDARRLYDDAFIDDSGFCSNTCELQCFPNPNRAWADTWEGETCVFVPFVPVPGDTTGNQYDEVGRGTFVDAQRYCESLGIGANLVKIDSASKNEFVYDLVSASLSADPTDYRDVVVCPFVFVDLSDPNEPVCYSAPQLAEEPNDDDEIPCPDDLLEDYVLDDNGNDPENKLCDDGDGNETVLCAAYRDDDGGLPYLCTDDRFPYWIGLFDDHTTQIDPPGLWKWVSDGSAVSGGNNGGNNPLWLSGQPDDLDNDTSTPGQQDCGVMLGSDNEGQVGEWADEACDSFYRFVCEFPLQPNP